MLKIATELEQQLGWRVRQVWLDFCKETKLPESHSHTAPWEELTLWEREVDRRIGAALYAAGLEAAAKLCDERAALFISHGQRAEAEKRESLIYFEIANQASICAEHIRRVIRALIPAAADVGQSDQIAPIVDGV
jgi:hypothetical protein